MCFFMHLGVFVMGKISKKKEKKWKKHSQVETNPG